MADYSKDLYDYKYECRRNCSAFDDGYEKGRAFEQIQSIEDTKMMATKYLDALDKVKKEAYQQGAKAFAEWLEDNSYLNWVGEGNDVNSMSAEEALSEWQKEVENDRN